MRTSTPRLRVKVESERETRLPVAWPRSLCLIFDLLPSCAIPWGLLFAGVEGGVGEGDGRGFSRRFRAGTQGELRYAVHGQSAFAQWACAVHGTVPYMVH